MGMHTEPVSRRIGPLLLGGLFVASFGLTVLAVWPAADAPLPALATPVELAQGAAHTDFPVNAGMTASSLATGNDLEPLITPAPTLQELAADSDPGTRDEAQALLNLLSEEAVAD
jgi:hypothetical protein